MDEVTGRITGHPGVSGAGLRLSTALADRYHVEREGAKRGQVVVVEHRLDEILRKTRQP
jgi:hypothetical protein